MALSRLEAWLYNFAWQKGFDGQPGHLDPKDPGGLTAWGMTYRTYCGWLKNTKQKIISQAQFVALAKEAFIPTYQEICWNAVFADHLPIGLDLMAADFSMVGGEHAAVETLQKCLKPFTTITADGVLGPVTEAALATHATHISRQDFLTNQLAYYKTCSDASDYYNGWAHRANAALKQATLDSGSNTPHAATPMV